MNSNKVRRARTAIRALEEALEELRAYAAYDSAAVIKLTPPTNLTLAGGVATVPILFSPSITNPLGGYNVTPCVTFAGTPDNPNNDPQNVLFQGNFGGQTTTRRGTVSFAPIAGLGAQQYAIGVGLVDISTGQIIASDNCVVSVTS
jgi:hypothetical protein